MTDDAHATRGPDADELVTSEGSAGSAGRAIVVNGRRFSVDADDISHRQLVRLAFPNTREFEADMSSLTVSYRDGPPAAAGGILSPIERTPIVDGETFVVTRTDKS